MVRSRIPLAASVLLFSVHCTTSQSPPGTDLAATRDGSSSALTVAVPPSPGNGPHAMVVCQNRLGNDCRAPDVTDVPSFNTNLIPPDAWFLNAPALPIPDPAVHSWSLGRAVNLWSYQGNFPDQAGPFATAGDNMDLDDRSLFPGSTPTSASPNHFTRVLSGFIALPDTGTTRTFSVATGEGYFFAIGGTAGGTLSASEFPASHRISYTIANTIEATFASAAQLYPFALAFYENVGVSSVEFAWAPGTKASNTGTGGLPSFNGITWSPGKFSLVPGVQMYSPDVRATMSWTGTAAANQTVTFHARVENAGLVPAFGAGDPPDVAAGSCPAAQGLCFTL